MAVLALAVLGLLIASAAKKRLAQQSPKKPIIVFVPGAWHTPATYDLLLPSLHAAGYRTTGVHLPTVGTTGPVSFAGDVSAIRKVVAGLVELGEHVFLVSHSYGGHPVTEALIGLSKKDRLAKGQPGGVVQLLYIAAIVPTRGISSLEAFGPMTPKEKGGTWMIFNDLGVSTAVHQI
jgi:pimeloyl-ACP methyl ester carboxylesterase